MLNLFAKTAYLVLYPVYLLAGKRVIESSGISTTWNVREEKACLSPFSKLVLVFLAPFLVTFSALRPRKRRKNKTGSARKISEFVYEGFTE